MWIIEEKTPLNPRLKGIEKRAPHKCVDFFAKKWGILAKKPTGGLTRGGEEKYEKKWQKNQPEDLQVVKRRKFEVKNDKKTYWRTYQGEKEKIKSKNGRKNYPK